VRSIIVGGDHVSVQTKRIVVDYLQHQGLLVDDIGTASEEVVVDYPKFALKVGRSVASGSYDSGVVLCGTGIGVSIAANKVTGVRAALCHNEFTARMARAHNDANVLAVGAWVIKPEEIPSILDTWLNTSYEGERHIPRVRMLDQQIIEGLDSSKKMVETGRFSFAMSVSIQETVFGPVLFMGHLEEGLESLHKSGFKEVEISLRNPDDISPATLKALLNKYGMKVSAFATGQACIHDNLCLSSTDPSTQRKAITRMKLITDLASEIGSGVILGGARGKLVGDQDEQKTQYQIGVKNIAECAAYAHKAGVSLYIEPINHYETNFINTAHEAVSLIQEIGVPSTRILLDTYHMNIEEVDIEQTILSTGKWIGYFHISDSNRQAPGHGHLNLPQILASLSETGYSGCISAEVLPAPDSQTAVIDTASFIASLNAVPEQVAGQ
jgi:5-keto-L-gluconate epimerase